YTLLYNSECDNSNPRSPAEIIQQVEREEKEEKKTINVGIPSMFKIDRKTDPKLIEQANQQYIEQNKKSFNDLIKEIKNRNAKKKSSVKPNVIESDDEDMQINKAEECYDETPEKEIIGRRSTVTNCDDSDDSDETEMSNLSGKTNAGEEAANHKNENGIEVMDDMQLDLDFESDTDKVSSPVLGRQIRAPSPKIENEKEDMKQKSNKLTPDMFITPQDDSNDNFSVLTQKTPDIIEHTEQAESLPCEAERERTRRILDSQLTDPDFVPDFEEMSEDFEIKKLPERKKRKAKKSSTPCTNLTSAGEKRTLRKRSKH
ncbi:hypothetical protein L9F63_019317, partial [Diploptera punctata]